MNKEQHSKEALLDVMAAYLRQIKKSGDEFPRVVLDDIEKSITHVLRVNGYNGRYND